MYEFKFYPQTWLYKVYTKASPNGRKLSKNGHVRKATISRKTKKKNLFEHILIMSLISDKFQLFSFTIVWGVDFTQLTLSHSSTGAWSGKSAGRDRKIPLRTPVLVLFITFLWPAKSFVSTRLLHCSSTSFQTLEI